jgi:hypothetical protein
MARSARCDVRRGAAVFVGSDKTIVSENCSVLESFRRLLLQIGGANIAGADRAFQLAYFVVARGRKACPLPPPQHGAWRDPCLIASLAKLARRGERVYTWRSRLSLSTWPVAFTLYCATAMVPLPFWSTSITKVERITPSMSLP